MSEQILRLRIVTRLGDRCTAVTLQVQGSDKTKFKVQFSVSTRFKIVNTYMIRREVHSRATAGTWQ